VLVVHQLLLTPVVTQETAVLAEMEEATGTLQLMAAAAAAMAIAVPVAAAQAMLAPVAVDPVGLVAMVAMAVMEETETLLTFYSGS
jgi:hypothetical protein